jgi:hypothetical protein
LKGSQKYLHLLSAFGIHLIIYSLPKTQTHQNVMQQPKHQLKRDESSESSEFNDDDDNMPLPVKSTKKGKEGPEVAQLPDWIDQFWASRFLPTLYAYINLTQSPFDDLKLMSDIMLNTVKSIFQLVYPAKARTYAIDNSNVVFRLVCYLLYCISHISTHSCQRWLNMPSNTTPKL